MDLPKRFQFHIPFAAGGRHDAAFAEFVPGVNEEEIDAVLGRGDDLAIHGFLGVVLAKPWHSSGIIRSLFFLGVPVG
jgi:hypothetical protein